MRRSMAAWIPGSGEGRSPLAVPIRRSLRDAFDDASSEWLTPAFPTLPKNFLFMGLLL